MTMRFRAFCPNESLFFGDFWLGIRPPLAKGTDCCGGGVFGGLCFYLGTKMVLP